MIKTVILSTLLYGTCPETQFKGFDDTLTKQEIQDLNQAKKRCSQIYPEAPCLKSFEKREEQVFWAICGAMNI